jgi:hypothetical protein
MLPNDSMLEHTFSTPVLKLAIHQNSRFACFHGSKSVRAHNCKQMVRLDSGAPADAASLLHRTGGRRLACTGWAPLGLLPVQHPAARSTPSAAPVNDPHRGWERGSYMRQQAGRHRECSIMSAWCARATCSVGLTLTVSLTPALATDPNSYVDPEPILLAFNPVQLQCLVEYSWSRSTWVEEGGRQMLKYKPRTCRLRVSGHMYRATPLSSIRCGVVCTSPSQGGGLGDSKRNGYGVTHRMSYRQPLTR